jgi:UDP-N-acetylmuramate--L-alanine ligase
MTEQLPSIPARIHLIGIGGNGMSALAEYLVSLQRQVSGSDLQHSPELEHLASLGVEVFARHDARNVDTAQMVVMSDAIPAENPELIEARQRGLRILRRAECFSMLGADKTQICVAGSHGKTTTTAMIAHVLELAGASPSFIMGARVPCLGNRRAQHGSGAHCAAEACEAFQNLSFYRPDLAVLTNVDDDHVQHYGSQAALEAAFRDFAERAPVIIAGGDDPGVRRVIDGLDAKVTTFGFESSNDISAADFRLNREGSFFVLWSENCDLSEFHVPIPGRHIVLNALACIASCRAVGLSIEEIAGGLKSFSGAARRWQEHGVIKGIRLIDDFAHHPAELKTTIDTARALLGPNERLTIAFQPQLFSRTLRLKHELATVLTHCDQVFLLPIYADGERDTRLVRSEMVADEIRKLGGAVELFDDLDDLVERAPALLKCRGIFILSGAGSIREAVPKVHRALLTGTKAKRLTNRRPAPAAPPKTLRSLVCSAVRIFAKKPESVLAMVTQHIELRPNSRAISDPSSALSYRELDLLSDQLAEALMARGATCGTVIAISLPFSTDLIATALALLKLGAVYLPLDDALPPERLAFMLERAEAKFLITAAGSRLAEVSLGKKIEKICVDQLRPHGFPDQSTFAETDSNRPAYICFTSGSTGYPKGVTIRQGDLFARVMDGVLRFGINHRTKTALNTSISFDVSLGEIWMTLCGGGELVGSGSSKTLVGEKLARMIETQNITHLFVTPSVLRSIRPRHFPALQCISAAGEACPQELVDSWANGTRFFNAYGPTEGTIYATVARCRAGKKVTIGRAIRQVNTYVLDDNRKPVAPGEIGELCLGGAGIAAGYLSVEKGKNDKFLTWSPNERQTDWIYRTGDLVRQARNGELSFLGRLDGQVKIRGHRIELEEIEQNVKRLPHVIDAALCVDESSAQELICFIVLEPAHALDEARAREKLAAWLPSYMLPSKFVNVAAIPLTTTGKKDRRALFEQFGRKNVQRHSLREPPRNDVERELAAIWKEMLELPDDIGMYDDFASLGGDSLRTLLVIAEVEQRLHVTVPPGFFSCITTVSRMAVQVAELLWNQEHGAELTADSGFESGRIYKQLRDLTAGWTGLRATEHSLIVSVGSEDADCDFFVCAQYDAELQLFGRHLGDSVRVHGMRSGHLVMDYTPENIEALAAQYLKELEALCPVGPLFLGGICQGGNIAQAIAEKLLARGRRIGPLVLMEQGRLRPYGGEIQFIFAKESHLNFSKRNDDGSAEIERLYGDRGRIVILPGGHTIFSEPGFSVLIANLKAAADRTRIGATAELFSR